MTVVMIIFACIAGTIHCGHYQVPQSFPSIEACSKADAQALLPPGFTAHGATCRSAIAGEIQPNGDDI